MILDLFMEGGLAKVTQSWRKTIEESDRRAQDIVVTYLRSLQDTAKEASRRRTISGFTTLTYSVEGVYKVRLLLSDISERSPSAIKQASKT